MQNAYREQTGLWGSNFCRGGGPPPWGNNFLEGGVETEILANYRGAVGNVCIYKRREGIAEVKGCSHIGDANMEFLHA